MLEQVHDAGCVHGIVKTTISVNTGKLDGSVLDIGVLGVSLTVPMGNGRGGQKKLELPGLRTGCGVVSFGAEAAHD